METQVTSRDQGAKWLRAIFFLLLFVLVVAPIAVVVLSRIEQSPKNTYVDRADCMSADEMTYDKCNEAFPE